MCRDAKCENCDVPIFEFAGGVDNPDWEDYKCVNGDNLYTETPSDHWAYGMDLSWIIWNYDCKTMGYEGWEYGVPIDPLGLDSDEEEESYDEMCMLYYVGDAYCSFDEPS